MWLLFESKDYLRAVSAQTNMVFCVKKLNPVTSNTRIISYMPGMHQSSFIKYYYRPKYGTGVT